MISDRSALKKANGHSEVMSPAMMKMVNVARRIFLVAVRVRLVFAVLRVLLLGVCCRIRLVATVIAWFFAPCPGFPCTLAMCCFLGVQITICILSCLIGLSIVVYGG